MSVRLAPAFHCTAFADDGAASDPAFERRFVRFATELEWYAEALKERRKSGVPY